MNETKNRVTLGEVKNNLAKLAENIKLLTDKLAKHDKKNRAARRRSLKWEKAARKELKRQYKLQIFWNEILEQIRKQEADKS